MLLVQTTLPRPLGQVKEARAEFKFPCQVLQGDRHTGFDSGVNAFHPKEETIY
jgi:hypothetical protein